MPSEPLFDFAVPDDLLREAVTQVTDPDVVADVTVMPGTGEGKPPPLVGILKSSGYAPLVLMTAAALVPGTFGNGITLVGHNLPFDWGFLRASCARAGVVFDPPMLCTLRMARGLFPELPSRALGAVAEHLGVKNGARHRALGDAMATARILIQMLEMTGNLCHVEKYTRY